MVSMLGYECRAPGSLAVVIPSQSLHRDRHRRCPFVVDTMSVTVIHESVLGHRATSCSSKTLVGRP